MKGDIVAETLDIYINAGDVNETVNFPFPDTVVLSAGETYQFTWRLTNGYPGTCNINNVFIFGLSYPFTRRRLASKFDTFQAQASPNSCTLAKSLSRSAAMNASTEAMCNEDVDNRGLITQGLFQQKCSQSAIKDHLLRTGSIYLYNPAGTEIFKDLDWPKYGVQDPCIAIDEENNRVFAVGGWKESGQGVSRIQVFNFDDDTFTTGSHDDNIDGWLLDQKRYGSMCFYYKQDVNNEFIVVISGMPDKEYEFTLRSAWLQDIRMFPIPKNQDQLTIWQSDYNIKSYSLPDNGNTISVGINVMDSRPLLYNDNILYLFGGKTHKESKPFVQRFDLSKIADGSSATLEAMTLTQKKALPLIDQVDLDIGDNEIIPCYMIFAGQSYLKSAIVADGISFDNLQLFCNEDKDLNVRRRLKDDDRPITKLTEFDQYMLEEGRKRRRRLQDGGETDSDGVVPDGSDEILIRTYKFGLDGLWYDFTVDFELCYDNNNDLRAAVEKFEEIIEAKPDGPEWIEFANDTACDILDESKEGYSGWSNGFGAVNVLDLQILYTNYQIPSNEELSHPERRKARFWDRNNDPAEDNTDYIWIDDVFDTSKGTDGVIREHAYKYRTIQQRANDNKLGEGDDDIDSNIFKTILKLKKTESEDGLLR